MLGNFLIKEFDLIFCIEVSFESFNKSLLQEIMEAFFVQDNFMVFRIF